MKKWLVVGCLILFLLGGLKGWKNQKETFISISGTVLEVNGTSALISTKKNLSEEDLYKSYDLWLQGDYDLISLSNIEEVEVGMVIDVMVKKHILETYPAQAVAKSYEVIKQIELTKELESPISENESVYSQQLVDIFPQKIGLNQQFNGYEEYGHIQTLKAIQTKETAFELLFEGQMRGGRGESGERVFKLTYEVTDDAIIEHIKNFDPYNKLYRSNLLNSIIPNKVILKLPLEVGNSWDETFDYKNQTYEAHTEIIRVDLFEDESKEYETLTTVQGIGDYDCYQENRVFKTGSGMISFNNVLSLETMDNQNQERDTFEDGYLFGYYLSISQ